MSDIIDTSTFQQNLRLQRQMAVNQYHRDNPVVRVYEAMREYITNFEAKLDQDHEVGVRLVSFGGVIFFHADEIEFFKPSVITFKGITPDGERVQLVQHVTQLNFLLKAAQKLQDKPMRIGFIWPEQ